MQANYLKKIIFFFTFFLTSLQLVKSQGDATTLRNADSLYKSANFFAAEPIFEQNLQKLKNPSSNFF